MRSAVDGRERDLEDDMVEGFLRWMSVERGRSRNTVAAYTRDIGAFRTWLSERHLSLSEADGADFEAYIDEMRTNGAAASSQARALAAMRALYRYLHDEGRLAADPTSLVTGVRVPGGLPKPLSVVEIETLLKSIVGEDAAARRDRAMLEVLYGTGARVSELCGLDLADVGRDGTLRLRGKGDKERIVPIGRPASAALEDYLSPGARGVLAGRARSPVRDREAVFLSTRGRRITRQKVHEVVRDAGLRAGLKGRVTPHVFRHSCATHMLEHGADLRVVQEMLGHASISTTQVYTRVSNSHLVETFHRTHPRAGGDQ